MQHRHRSEDHSRRAIPALKCFRFQKRLLHGIEVLASAESFNGGDLLSCRGAGGSDATAHRIAVQQDGAGAALAFPATVLGAGQFQPVAENVQERFVRGRINLMLASIHNEGDSHSRTSQEVYRNTTLRGVLFVLRIGNR